MAQLFLHELDIRTLQMMIIWQQNDQNFLKSCDSTELTW